ncbi:MAG: 8-amino-7-oxononanoate synthase [Verrucomicrobiales bacterium]|nr:8-amino-7-oxononanoate synthase [Verrucomicrobiales bacterium]MED5585578.1 8-amino-7-oxononanoate synthase [Verrucomicrobiota bacterium]
MRDPDSELDQLKEKHLLRALDQGINSPVETKGLTSEDFVQFSSNDYLGLASHAELKAAAIQATERFGVGSRASRLLRGGSLIHKELESYTAEFLGTEAALYFANGYAAALGTLNALLRKGDTVILDKQCHACLIDGARLSGATIRVFPHNNLHKLEKLLISAHEKSSDDSRTLIITESVFSMDGDSAPLKEIIALKKQFSALLMVDEAHALGILGTNGRGLCHSTGEPRSVDLRIVTFGKSVGSAGGVVAATSQWIDLILNRARSFIYSTAPPHAQAAAALAGLKIIASPEGDHLRQALADNVRLLCEKLPIKPPAAAIIPLILGEETSALRAADHLRAGGCIVPAIRYPTVARGAARLRVSLSAAHTTEEITRLADNLSLLLDSGKFTLSATA